MRLELGDCLEVLKNIPDNSVDSIVTDPPYGISFMHAKWDYDVPSTEIWMECLRVLKPGGHLLSFSGSRTYHRMVVRIEDAGFEIRDQIMWVYGSGFPKSHNIGKAVDKLQGNDREVVGDKPYKSGNLKTENILGGDYSMDNSVQLQETKGTSEWEGWGTALKPAHEPIVMARKPLSEKTVAENVLRWGTGGINIDDSRVGTEQIKSVYGGFTLAKEDGRDIKKNNDWIDNSKVDNKFRTETTEGRWPANIIFDEEAGQVLDQQSGIGKSTASVWKNYFGIFQSSPYHRGLGSYFVFHIVYLLKINY
jgi:site-specific DNA-methyltransferase (adenine-specific)